MHWADRAALVGDGVVSQVVSMTTVLVNKVEETDGLPPRERRAAMLTVGIAIAISVLSTAIANIALPAMARELHATPAESIWVVNAYQLAVVI
jgi:MFS transporter, DHA2 family, multidrug resistance protein